MQLNNLSKIKQSLFAWGMSKANQADDHLIQIKKHPKFSNFAKLKKSFFSNLEGTILEIGPGVGINLNYYPQQITWLGIEPNLFMHFYLEKEAKKLGLENIKLVQGSAENIPVEEETIDTVISTHVLCSVTNLATSLQEIKRILKPGGKFIFIEHIAGQDGTLTSKMQNAIEPIWKSLFNNCHPNRQTEKILENVSFSHLNYQHFEICFPIVSPHIAGIAIK
jgi:ubiquinone/menaquinone biosynthesis C-methylase UbiE